MLEEVQRTQRAGYLAEELFSQAPAAAKEVINNLNAKTLLLCDFVGFNRLSLLRNSHSLLHVYLGK